MSVDEILTRMAAMGLPNLWIPARDSFVAIPEIPILATGKVDLKQVQEIANAEFTKRGRDVDLGSKPDNRWPQV